MAGSPDALEGREHYDRALLALAPLDDDALVTLSGDLGVDLADGDASAKKIGLIRAFDARGQLDMLEDAIERATAIRKLRVSLPSASPAPRPAVIVFVSYSHKDEKLRVELGKDLEPLERDGLVEVWHDGKIAAGDEFDADISEYLDAAHVILLLVSRPFLHSQYIQETELPRALKRHESGEARVIPIILKPSQWSDPPWFELFGKLQVLPKDGKPINKWRQRDDAFVDIYRAMRKTIQALVDERSGNNGDG